jgi:glutamate/tyrosine decarboxylase-like PLP-dependent enzyme
MTTREQKTTAREAPIELEADAFRQLGHRLVDEIASRLEQVPDGPITPGERPEAVRQALDSLAPLPNEGASPSLVLERATRLLFEHSLFNGHPRFFGFITSPPAPIGILGEMLSAAVNANVGAWLLSPAATEIELQTVRWIAEFIGYPTTSGGLMVSGGNMANMVGFLAGRAAKTPWDVRTHGSRGPNGETLRVYASGETHTWLQKACDLAGLGTSAVRWIPTDADQRMDVEALARTIDEDRSRGDVPMLVVGTAGTVSTGAVDPLRAIAGVCRSRDVWFHVDGAYGGMAAAIASSDLSDLRALSEADSVAVDPHKWLYAPIEAGCTLVRNPAHLRDAFTYHPPYYHFEDEVVNFVDFGPQNTRGFKALKVWLAFQQAGAAGYRQMIADDVSLAKALGEAVQAHGEFELRTQQLSIVTFRYVPPDLRARVAEEPVRMYIDDLNRALLDASQRAGDVFVSGAVTAGTFVLRACIVNFHTTYDHVREVPDLIAPLGRKLDGELRPRKLR